MQNSSSLRLFSLLLQGYSRISSCDCIYIDWDQVLFRGLCLAPVQLVFGVALPFAVMYVLSTKVSSESIFKSTMVSTFLGCWLGGVTIFAVNILITFSSGGSYGYDSILQTTLWVIWTIFATAFSSIFFVSLAAILFAYYQKQLTKST